MEHNEQEEKLNEELKSTFYILNSRNLPQDLKQVCFEKMYNTLKKGASPNLILSNGDHLFEFFVKNGFDKGADFLVQNKNWDPNYKTMKVPSTSPLSCACHYHKRDLVKQVIQHPFFDPMFRDDQGRTPLEQMLHMSPNVYKSSSEEIKLILKNKRLDSIDKKRLECICIHASRMKKEQISAYGRVRKQKTR